MGDRANVFMVQGPKATSGIYLYTHWNGYEWPERLRQALEFGEERWSDPQYLARIIASQVFADLVDSTTGGGLSIDIGDNEYPIICVDLVQKIVGFAEEGTEHDVSTWHHTCSFADFVAQSKAGYPEEQ